MILPQAVEFVAFLALFGALLFTHFWRTSWFLFLCGFTLPLAVPRLEIGIGLDFCKLVAPVGLGLLILRGKRPAVTREAVRPFGIFVAYACLVTLVWMALEYNWLHRYRVVQALNVGAGAGQSTYKMPVQLGGVLGQLLCAYLVPWLATKEHDAHLAIRGYITGCLTSVGVGLLSYLATGFATVNSYASSVDGGIGRVGGLSGEPKFLGASLVPLVVLSFCRFVFDRRIGILRSGLPFALALVAQVLTFSASAWLATAVGILVASVLAFVYLGKSRLGVLLIVLGTATLTLAFSAFVSDVVQTRFLSRLTGDTSQLADQKDMYVFQLLSDEPENVFFGYGLGGGDLSMAPYMEYLHVKYGRTPTPGTNGARFLVDLGVVGLLLMFFTSVAWWRRLAREGYYAPATAAVACAAGLMFCSLIAVPGYYFLMGAILTITSLRKSAIAEPANVPQSDHPSLATAQLNGAAAQNAAAQYGAAALNRAAP